MTVRIAAHAMIALVDAARRAATLAASRAEAGHEAEAADHKTETANRAREDRVKAGRANAAMPRCSGQRRLSSHPN
jgi:hypothetical protein